MNVAKILQISKNNCLIVQGKFSKCGFVTMTLSSCISGLHKNLHIYAGSTRYRLWYRFDSHQCSDSDPIPVVGS